MYMHINKTMRHLKFCYISILTNLLRTESKYNKIFNVSLFYLYFVTFSYTKEGI